jgi:xanthine dehydrogenase YagT iron-sulfur-binding subunit
VGFRGGTALVFIASATPNYSAGGSMVNEQNQGVSRRSFLRSGGLAAGAGLLVNPLLANAKKLLHSKDTKFISDGAQAVKLNVNGQDYNLHLDPRVTLLDALREVVQLTGTKKGCDHGQCGACTVLINGRRVPSCLTLAVACEGDKVTTIEGLGTPDAMHPMQKAFCDNDAYQCGYCTSGQIVSAVAMLKEPGAKDAGAIKESMSGNICRCGAYKNILAAIEQCRKEA